MDSLAFVSFLCLLLIGLSRAFIPPSTSRLKNFQQHELGNAPGRLPALTRSEADENDNLCDNSRLTISRADLFEKSKAMITTGLLSLMLPESAFAKCTDIETCREEGERKIEADLKLNPITKLSDGVRYRVLQPSAPNGAKVKDGSSVDLIYSISTASGQYMYSKGFGFEKVTFGGKQTSDLGLDSLRVVIGKHNIPVGIESALIGMGRGERRRVELPPGVGFETSNWEPKPTTRRGITQITKESFRGLQASLRFLQRQCGM
jgi:FKBP-type peptidyl-prolyl cis-trans isomerase